MMRKPFQFEIIKLKAFWVFPSFTHIPPHTKRAEDIENKKCVCVWGGGGGNLKKYAFSILEVLQKST